MRKKMKKNLYVKNIEVADKVKIKKIKKGIY